MITMAVIGAVIAYFVRRKEKRKARRNQLLIEQEVVPRTYPDKSVQ